MQDLESKQPPSLGAIRTAALALIAEGNTLESVAAVYGIPVDILGNLVARPAPSLQDEEAPLEPMKPWHRFPGIAVYRYGADGLVAALALLLAGLIVIGGPLVFGPGQSWSLHAWAGACIACAIPLIVAIRTAPRKRFVMYPDAIVRYTRAGRTVLRYADIAAAKVYRAKTGYYVELFTRRGVGMTLAPSVEQMEDEDLRAWLDAIPGPGGLDLPVWTVYKSSFAFMALIAAMFIVVPSVVTMRYMDKANSSASWPTTEGIVTESGWRAGGGKSCPSALRLRYTYTLGRQHYVGDNYQFGGVCTAQARRIAAANPVGKRVIVHYRAAHPADSVIVPGGVAFDKASSVFASLGFVALAFAVYFTVRKKQSA
jgi:hypothetical protein